MGSKYTFWLYNPRFWHKNIPFGLMTHVETLVCLSKKNGKKIINNKAIYQKIMKICSDEKLAGKKNVEDEKPITANCDYLYVGVSPKGRYGYNYWYVDEDKQTQANTYVWVKMGRRDTEQIVYVDSVRYCNADNVPYPIEKTKRVLRQATKEETEEVDALWDE